MILLPMTKTCLFVNAEHSLTCARDWFVHVGVGVLLCGSLSHGP